MNIAGEKEGLFFTSKAEDRFVTHSPHRMQGHAMDFVSEGLQAAANLEAYIFIEDSLFRITRRVRWQGKRRTPDKPGCRLR